MIRQIRSIRVLFLFLMLARPCSVWMIVTFYALTSLSNPAAILIYVRPADANGCGKLPVLHRDYN